MLDKKVLTYQVVAALVLVLVIVLGLGAPSARAATDSEEEVSCGVKPTVRGIDATTEKNVEILADSIDFPKRGVVHLRGYTQLIRGGYRVYADELIYDKNTNNVVARGVVKFETPKGDVIRTSILSYDVQTGKIESGPADFLLADRQNRVLGDGHSTVNAHGTAQAITIENNNELYLADARVTSCLDGRKDMTFTAENLSVDMDKGVRSAERAKVRIAEPNRHDKLDDAVDTVK